MVSRFISKKDNNSYYRIQMPLNKGQAMLRGRDAALKIENPYRLGAKN